MVIYFTPADNLAGMLEVEDDNDNEHKSCIEDIKVDLRAEKDSSLTTGVLGYAKNAPNHDEETGKVEDPKVACPRKSRSQGGTGRSGVHSLVPSRRDDDEESEEGDLEEETGEDDVIGEFGRVLGLCLREHAAT